jgi:hypothetical protein
MPTSQAPTILALLDEIQARLDTAHDTADLDQLRGMRPDPTRVGVSERTDLLTVLRGVRDQLDLTAALRAGLLDSIRQARPQPPEPHGQESSAPTR